MASEHVAAERPIQLSFRSVKQVVVEPDDENRFVTTVQEAARACKQAQNDKEWQEQFNEMLGLIREWGEGHADRIRSVFLDVGDGHLNIRVATFSEQYDMDFDDELTDFDLNLVGRFPWLNAEVMQSPASRLEPSEKAILVYGNGN